MKRNEALKLAMKSWLETAVAKIQEAIISNPASGETTDWNKIPFAISEYEKVLEELKKDAKISAHFNSRIESEAFFEPLKLATEDTLKSVLSFFVKDNQPFFKPEFFDKVYDFFEKSFYGDDIEFRAIAPVSGLLVHILKEKTGSSATYDDDPEPFELAPDLIIRPLNEEEYRIVHQLEIVRRYPFRMSDLIYAVCANYRFPKKLTPIPTGSPQPAPAFPLQPTPLDIKMQEVNRLLAETVWILRLFKIGSISNSGSVHYGRNFFVGNGQHWFSSDLPQAFANVPPYTLVRDEVPKLRSLWEQFQKVKTIPALKNLLLALRRLNYCRTRSDLEDKAIDLMIAAETLAKPPHVADKSSVIAEYFASYFPGNESAVKEKMRKVYGMRNAIIHDGSLEKWVKIKSNRGIDILDYIFQAEEFVRIVLMKEISGAGNFFDNCR